MQHEQPTWALGVVLEPWPVALLEALRRPSLEVASVVDALVLAGLIGGSAERGPTSP